MKQQYCFIVGWATNLNACFNTLFLAPVDGQWSPWAVLAACNPTCGEGKEILHRQCITPSLAHGGKDCEGYDFKYETCNIQPCPGKRKLSVKFKV